jgi:transcriptional antiterminator RfaH
MSFWAVVHCKAGRERLAQLNLRRQHFVTYLPMFLARVGKVHQVKILFPRYIFARIENQWHGINNTFGVSRLIMTSENKPAVVQEYIIEELRAREDKKGLILLPEPQRFQQGENVKLANGPFSGYNGLYQGMKDSDRARVLIDLLGRKVQIEVNETDLSAVALGSS